MKLTRDTAFLINIDGVLLNAEKDIVSCLNAALDDSGFTANITLDEYRESWGKPLVEIIQNTGKLNLKRSAEIAAAYEAMCRKRGFVQTEVLHDTHSLLRELWSAGVQLVSMSSYIPDSEGLLREKNLSQYFVEHHTTLTTREVLLKKAVDSVSAKTKWIVSDRIQDITYAINHQGCDSAAITWGNNDNWDLAILTPDLVLETARDLHLYFIQGRPLWDQAK